MEVGHKERLQWVEDMLEKDDRKLLRLLKDAPMGSSICRACQFIPVEKTEPGARTDRCPRCRSTHTMETRRSLKRLLPRR